MTALKGTGVCVEEGPAYTHHSPELTVEHRHLTLPQGCASALCYLCPIFSTQFDLGLKQAFVLAV